MTAGDLISSALQRLGVVGADKAAEADDLETGRLRLNDLVDSWATERLAIYTISRTTFSLVNGQQTYTVGTGGDVNVARPVFIERVGLVDTSTTPATETSLGDPMTDWEYQSIPQKTLSGTYPNRVYYNPTYPSTGYGTLTFFPIPTAASLQGVLYAPAAVAEFAALTTPIYVPPGYRRALRDNLALELSADFDAPVSPGLVQSATESKANLKRINVRLVDLATPGVPGVRGGWYDITTDT
jgi:hypothetical protein